MKHLQDIVGAVVAVGDAVEAIANPDPDVVARRHRSRDIARQLRLLRLVRVLSSRLARLQARRGVRGAGGRVEALRARLDALQAALDLFPPPPIP